MTLEAHSPKAVSAHDNTAKQSTVGIGTSLSIFVLVFFSLGTLAALWLCLRLLVNYQKQLLADLERISSLEKTLFSVELSINDNSDFFRGSRLRSVLHQIETLRTNLPNGLNPSLLRKKREILARIDTLIADLPRIREENNQRFFEIEKIAASKIFLDSEGNDLLTDEQVKAVLSNDNRNLIVAGAGSGKTRVIDFKVRYLVHYKKINPGRILLLSFSKKSAGDLMKKLSASVPGIRASTIHAFSFQSSGSRNLKVFDEAKNELGLFITKALVWTLRDQHLFGLFERFYEKFFTDIRPLIFYQNLSDLRADLKKVNSRISGSPDIFGELEIKRSIKTLRGEYVRSLDERFIADFLYLQEIEYEYEPRYPLLKELYFPDFYLPEYDIYLEHFAITSSGQPPAYFGNPRKYLDGIHWKRRIHAEHGTKLVESMSYLLNEKGSANYLSDILRSQGVRIQDTFNDHKVHEKLSRQFSRIFTKFYNSFKLSGLSIDELKKKYTETKYNWFLEIFEKFLDRLEELIRAENKIGFHDMIIKAIGQASEGCVRSCDYIIVDEFQDTSKLALRLMDTIHGIQPETTFIGVGDDWQSIYGFNGSDVTIISNYNNEYSDVSVCRLNSNFRSHSRIVELGKQFISRNPSQIKKDVVSKCVRFSSSEIGFLSFQEMEKKIQEIPESESIYVIYRYNEDCPANQGCFQRYFELDSKNKPVKRAGVKKSISLMTIHASKGLEAQHVFILFPDGIRKKFPSDIEDHFVFNMLKTSSEDFPFSEERRLLYVGITRAEQNLYFVSRTPDPHSVFWDELKELVETIP